MTVTIRTRHRQRANKAWAKLVKARFLAIAVSAMLAGCSTLPGLHFDDGQAEPDNVWFGEYKKPKSISDPESLPVTLKPITASLVASQRRKRQLNSNFDLERLMQMRRATGYEYLIGAGDVLEVVVWGHPELSSKDLLNRNREPGGSVVNAEGEIFFPYAGMLPVKGKTVRQVRKAITSKLAVYVQNPQVDVRVSQFHSQKVYVAGNVRKPGWLPVTNVAMRLPDALARAGGVIDETSRGQVIVTRGETEYLLNLRDLEQAGGQLGHVLLRNGDSLYIPDNSQEKVYVFGETNLQLAVPIREGRLTLADALAAAEGLNLHTAAGQGVYVMRGLSDEDIDKAGDDAQKPVVFQLDARSAEMLVLADRFELQSGDVVFAAAADLVRFNRALARLLPSLSAIFQISVIGDSN